MKDLVPLSVRMKMNADLVPEGVSVADIGCDHGYVAMYLAAEKKCPKVIAMDVNKGPLAIAQENIRLNNLQEQIQCRLSDGMKALHPGEVDTVLLAGMGGMLVCRILQQSPDVLEQVQTLVLQPQSDWQEVRKKLFKSGFKIETESFCKEAEKYYVAIRAIRGEERLPYTSSECRYGRLLPEQKDILYGQYLVEEKEKKERLLKQLRVHKTEKAAVRALELEQEAAQLQRILSEKYGNT